MRLPFKVYSSIGCAREGHASFSFSFKAKDTNEVRWKDFCEEIEQIFATPCLDKDPLKEAEVYTPESVVSRNCLPIEMSEAANRAMRKISKMVSDMIKSTGVLTHYSFTSYLLEV